MATEKEKSKPVEELQFADELSRQHKAAIKGIKGTIKNKINVSVRKSNDTGVLVEQNIIKIFNETANEITDKVRDMKIKGDETFNHDLLKQHKESLSALDERFALAMEISGGETGKIATKEELAHFIRTGLKMLERTSAKRILEAQSRSVNPTYLDIMGEIHKNPDKKLTTKELDFLEAEVKKLTESATPKGLESPGDGIGMVLLAYLKPKHRLQLMRHMIDKPGTHDLIVDLVKMDYLSTAQARTLFEEELASQKRALEKARRKARKEIEAEITALEGRIEEVESDKTQETRERVREVRKEAVTHMRRQYGHKNYAKKLFSLKGIASAALFANGCLTVGGNVLANLHSPLDIVGNPCLWLGAGMAGAGLEISGGFGGMAPTVGKGLAKLAKKKDEIEKEKQEESTEAMEKSLTNHPTEAEFYFHYAPEIVEVYNAKKRENPDTRVEITLENLKLNYEDPEFKKKYGRVSKQRLEEMAGEWVRYFYETTAGVRKKEARAQRKFVREAFIKEGVSVADLTETV